jgi:hypothetical protein
MSSTIMLTPRRVVSEPAFAQPPAACTGPPSRCPSKRRCAMLPTRSGSESRFLPSTWPVRHSRRTRAACRWSSRRHLARAIRMDKGHVPGFDVHPTTRRAMPNRAASRPPAQSKSVRQARRDGSAPPRFEQTPRPVASACRRARLQKGTERSDPARTLRRGGRRRRQRPSAVVPRPPRRHARTRRGRRGRGRGVQCRLGLRGHR